MLNILDISAIMLKWAISVKDRKSTQEEHFFCSAPVFLPRAGHENLSCESVAFLACKWCNGAPKAVIVELKKVYGPTLTCLSNLSFFLMRFRGSKLGRKTLQLFFFFFLIIIIENVQPQKVNIEWL